MTKLDTNTQTPETSTSTSGKAAPRAKAIKVSKPPVSPTAPASIVEQQDALLVHEQPSSVEAGGTALAPVTTNGLDALATAVATEAPSKAVAWQVVFTSALKAEQSPAELKALLESGLTDRLWAGLKDQNGKKFRTFESFCTAPLPYGLDTSTDEVKRFLNITLGERAAKLLTAPEPAQGRRTDLEHADMGGPKSSHDTPRNERRRVAVNRAAPVVQKLYKEGLIPLVDAATLGPARNTLPETKVRVAQVVAKLEKLVADRDSHTADEFKVAVKNIAGEVNPPPVEVLTSVCLGDPTEVLSKILKVHLPEGTGLVLGLTSTQAKWASLPKTFVAMTVNDDLGEDERYSAILLDDPEENRSAAFDKAKKLDAGGVIVVEVQPTRIDGVMQDVTGQLVFALEDYGIHWVDQVIVSKKPSAANRQSAAEQKTALVAHSTLLVFRKSVTEKGQLGEPGNVDAVSGEREKDLSTAAE